MYTFGCIHLYMVFSLTQQAFQAFHLQMFLKVPSSLEVIANYFYCYCIPAVCSEEPLLSCHYKLNIFSVRFTALEALVLVSNWLIRPGWFSLSTHYFSQMKHLSILVFLLGSLCGFTLHANHLVSGSFLTAAMDFNDRSVCLPGL